MTVRNAIFILAFIGAAGCESPVAPDSGAGVGFSTYYAPFEAERAERDALLAGQATGRFGPPPSNFAADRPVAVGSDELARAGIGRTQVVNGSPLDPMDPMAVQTQAEAEATNLANNPEISDEQSFDAVAGRETIESDAERRAVQVAELVVVDPVPLPQTRAATGANIVAYALNAPNAKGQQWYSRSVLSGDTRFQRNCASYNNPDAAQRDFLARGGPERDSRGIDPDGDGFACGWDPAPFKLAADG